MFVATKSNSSEEPESASGSSTPFICNGTSANSLLGRWRLCVEMFGQAFLEDVGCEPSSVLNELGRFDVKETKFRREMERLRNSTQRDLTLEVGIVLTLFLLLVKSDPIMFHIILPNGPGALLGRIILDECLLNRSKTSIMNCCVLLQKPILAAFEFNRTPAESAAYLDVPWF